MNDPSHAPASRRLLTVERVLIEHEQLLAAQAERDDVQQVRGFVDRLEQSGAYFDEAFERKAIQGTLDYWTSELAKHATTHNLAGQKRRAIREFDAEALKALQGEFENPFVGIADRMRSLGKHSAPAAVRLIEDVAKPQQLRFQEGLLKEIVSQLTGDSDPDRTVQARRDRDDARLLEFCLWHLFEDPETRLGDKLYRPKRSGHEHDRVDYFSCKVYLVRKADELFAAVGRPKAGLDMLMRMEDSDAGTQRLQSFLRSIAGKFEDSKFELYGREVPTLLEFLQESRLAFNEGGRWGIVHPALGRWDPLKKRRWEVERKRRVVVLSVTVGLAAAVTSLVWLGWSSYWTKEAMERLANAEVADKPKDRLIESVAGLGAAKRSMSSENSYAIQVGNDAIGTVIGARARSGKGDAGPLKPYPNVPDLPCEPVSECPVFAVSFSGTHLAAAWQVEGRVTLRVFKVPEDFRLATGEDGALRQEDLKGATQTAPWMNDPRVQELELVPPLNRKSVSLAGTCKDRALRFSEDGRTVSFECLYTVSERISAVQWISAVIKGDGRDAGSPAAVTGAAKVVEEADALTPCNGGKRPPRTSRVTSVFLGPESGHGFVTVRGDGYVQIWHQNKQPPCLSTEFRSDFVRVATGGRPDALAIQDVDVPTPTYAISALSPTPVVRVYEQEATHARLLMEHYPPAGVGRPVGIRFTENARCLQIRAIRKDAGKVSAVEYYLILDLNRLATVSRALERDLGSEEAVSAPSLEEYRRAIETECRKD